MCAVDLLDIGEVADGLLHDVVERGVERAKERQQLMAHLVATVLQCGVGAVLDIFKVVLADVGIDVGTAEYEQRSYYAAVDWANAVETGNACATQEVDKEGLNGVVAMVGHNDIVKVFLLTDLFEKIVAQMACGFLDGEMVEGGILSGVELCHMDCAVVALGQLAHKLFVAVGVVATQMEIAVCYLIVESSVMAEVLQHYRVASAAYGQQESCLADGECVAVVLESW